MCARSASIWIRSLLPSMRRKSASPIRSTSRTLYSSGTFRSNTARGGCRTASPRAPHVPLRDVHERLHAVVRDLELLPLRDSPDVLPDRLRLQRPEAEDRAAGLDRLPAPRGGGCGGGADASPPG